MLQTPIIIEKKKNQPKSLSMNKQLTDRRGTVKKVEPFVPIAVPKRDHNKFKV